jgi:hypothetical protein
LCDQAEEKRERVIHTSSLLTFVCSLGKEITTLKKKKKKKKKKRERPHAYK